MKKRKRILYLIAGLIVMVLLMAPFINSSQNQKPEFVIAEASLGTITKEITATGILNPVQTVDVGTQVSGVVTKLFVDFNDIVKKGQLIAQIDTINLNIAIIDAQANIVRCEAQFAQQKLEYERYIDLLEKKVVPQSDFDIVKANFLVSASNLKSAEANLQRAKTNFSYATITAPIDGVIINRNINEGQTVAANFSAPVLYTIANDLKKMQLQAQVDEADIGHVKTNQDVRFTVDAYPDEIFFGKVQQIRLQPTTNQNVVTYTVIIEAPNPDLKLLPGMNANISIIIMEHINVLTVPLSAFAVKIENDTIEDGNKSRIFLLTPKDSIISLNIITGIDDGNIIEIVSNNILEGAKIIIGMKDPETKQMKSFLPSPPKPKPNQMMHP